MKLVRKGFIVFWGWVLLILGLAVLVTIGVGRWKLASALDYVAESGRVTDWNALHGEPVAPELNAALLQEAAALRFTAAPEEFQKTLKDYRFQEERTAEELAREHADLLRSDAADDILRLTDQAIARPHVALPAPPSFATELDHAWEIRIITKLYGGRAILAALEGDAAGCEENLLKGFRYAALPVYPSFVLGVMIDGAQLHNMTNAYEACLQAGVLEPRVTQRVEDLLNGMDFRARTVKAWDSERLIWTRGISQETEYEELAWVLSPWIQKDLPPYLAQGWLGLYLPFHAAASIRAFVDLADAAENVPVEKLHLQAQEFWPDYEPYLQFNAVQLMDNLLPRPEARLRLAIYAGQVYRGEAPEELPIDPFTGRPMLTRSTDQGALMIYSVGRNRQDQQGEGDDLTFVLPQPVVAAEK
jgi:hypothetical protein